MASLPPAAWRVVPCDLSELTEQLGQVPQARERRLWMVPTVGDPAGRAQFPLLAGDPEETQFPKAGDRVISVTPLCGGPWHLYCRSSVTLSSQHSLSTY